jgi:DNA modification methylase
LGSGSSAIAAHISDLEFVGVEINEGFYESAVERIAATIGAPHEL